MLSLAVTTMTNLQLGASVLIPEAVLAICSHCGQGVVGGVEGNVVHLQTRQKEERRRRGGKEGAECRKLLTISLITSSALPSTP